MSKSTRKPPAVQATAPLPGQEKFDPTLCQGCGKVLVDQTGRVVAEYAFGGVEDYCRECFKQGRVLDPLARRPRQWEGNDHPIGYRFADWDGHALAVVPTRPPTPAGTLTDLVERINCEHHAAETALNDGLRHALEAGRLLMEAKAQVDHGEWLPWLKANFDGSTRTARAYTRAAKRWPTLEAKWQRAANLSLREVARLTAEPKAKAPAATGPNGHKSFLQLPVEARRKTCEQWWDILAGYTLLLDVAGWSVEKIADTMGMPMQDIDAILHPRPPRYSWEHFSGAFADRYADAVGEHIALQLMVRYQQAEYHAEREGMAEVIPALRVLGSQQERIYKRLEGSTYPVAQAAAQGSRNDAEHSNLIDAAICCVIDDMREALGIAARRRPVPARCMFLWYLIEWVQLIEHNQRNNETELEAVADEGADA